MLKNFFPIIAALIIASVGLVSYANSLNGGLVMDDGQVITEEKLSGYLSNPLGYLRPNSPRVLANYTFALNYSIHGTQTFGYHLVNLWIHLLNSCMVAYLGYLIASKLVRPEFHSRHQMFSRYTGLLAGLIFVSHPLQTMAVTYITQRYTSLATTFYLLAFVAVFSLGFARQSWIKILGYVIALSAFVLGLATKETVATLPLVLLATMVLVNYTKTGKLLIDLRKHLLPLLVVIFLIALGVYLAFYFYNLDFMFSPKPTTNGETVTWYQYALTQFRVNLTYISRVLVPLRLNADHDIRVATNLFEPLVLVGIGVWVGLWAIVWRFRSTYPVIAWGILWFLVTLLVDGSILPISDVSNEYRVYLPMVGASIVGGYLLSWLMTNKKLTTLYLSAILIAIYGVLTFNRNFIYANSESFWKDITLKSPNKARGFVNYGMEVHARGRVEEAIVAYDRALQIDPERATAMANIGVVFAQVGELEQAFAIYNQVLAIEPENVNALNGLGIISLKEDDPIRAVDYFQRALEIEPDNLTVQKNLGLAQAQLDQRN